VRLFDRDAVATPPAITDQARDFCRTLIVPTLQQGEIPGKPVNMKEPVQVD